MAIKLTSKGQQLLDQNQRIWMSESDNVKARYAGRMPNTNELIELFNIDSRMSKERQSILSDPNNYEDDGL